MLRRNMQCLVAANAWTTALTQTESFDGNMGKSLHSTLRLHAPPRL